jgi:hypothetical protein
VLGEAEIARHEMKNNCRALRSDLSDRVPIPGKRFSQKHAAYRAALVALAHHPRPLIRVALLKGEYMLTPSRRVSIVALSLFTLALHGCGGGGGDGGGSSQTQPQPTASLSANVTTVAQGGSVTLTWSSTNAASCTASGGAWTGAKATSGSESVGPLSATTTLTVNCGGASQSVTVTVTPPPTAEGVYGGTLTGGTYSDFQALVLENGDFWSLYGNDTGSIFYVYGFVQGSGASSNGSFTSSNIRDYGFYPALSGTLASTYNSSAKTISGTLSAQGGTVQFSGGPVPGSLYDYNTAATLSSVSGNWSAMSSTGGSVSINIAANGSLTTSESGCTGAGSISPRPSGKNVFNVSVTFGPAPCLLPNQTATGIAIAYPLPTGQKQFVAALASASRTAGIAVFGIR